MFYCFHAIYVFISLMIKTLQVSIALQTCFRFIAKRPVMFRHNTPYGILDFFLILVAK